MDNNQFRQFLDVVKQSLHPEDNPIEKIKREALRAQPGPRLGMTTNFGSWKTLFNIYRSKLQLDVTIADQQVPADFQAKLLLSVVEEGVIPKIKLAMEGSTIWNTTILNATEPNQNARFTAWLTQIEHLFAPPSESRLAKVDFKSRTQHHNEDISSYYTSKLALFETAYGADARDNHFDNFLDEVIRGIYSMTVKREVRGRKIATVDELRQELVDIVAIERLRIEDGSSENTSLDGLAATTRSLANTGVEMMDIGGNGINRIATKQDQCHNCKKYGHFAKDCWQKNPRGRGRGGQGATRNYYKVDHGNVICDYCKARGHLKKQCRKKMRDEQYRGSGTSYYRGKRGNGRGGFNQNKHNKRGLKTIQDDQEEGDEMENQEDQSFLDDGEELQQRN